MEPMEATTERMPAELLPTERAAVDQPKGREMSIDMHCGTHVWSKKTATE